MRLLLVDGHYYAYRSFHAIQHLKNSRGEPTNAVYGFVKTIRRMLTDLKPDLAAVIMDAGLSKERMELQPEYKAQRAEMPDEMVSQMPLIEKIIPALGLKRLISPGEEADDLIASYVEEAKKEGHEVILATNDKDLMQMVTDKLTIYQTKDGAFQLLGIAEVEAKWGVPPHQIGEILALTGDAVDNIPGIPGVGPETAANWIKQFGSLDNLLSNHHEIKSDKLRAALAAAKDQIASNREMVRLRANLPLPESIKDLIVKPNYEDLIKQLEYLEFKTLLAETKVLQQKEQPKLQGDLFV